MRLPPAGLLEPTGLPDVVLIWETPAAAEEAAREGALSDPTLLATLSPIEGTEIEWAKAQPPEAAGELAGVTSPRSPSSTSM